MSAGASGRGRCIVLVTPAPCSYLLCSETGGQLEKVEGLIHRPKCLFGIALPVLACWPLMIWRLVKNGMPLSPAVFETLLWPLAALTLWLAARVIWPFLSEG
jgi:hypothetical protein